MINSKGSVWLQVIVIVGVAALTTAIMLLLIHFDVLSPQAQEQQVNVLNAEFIPLERTGDLQIRQVDLCNYVDTKFNCYNKTELFQRDDNIYLRFLVESSVYQGEIMIARNYRVINPEGNIILDLEQQNSYTFRQESPKESQAVAFADYFTLGNNPQIGQYQIEIIVENPLLNKKVTIIKRFDVG